MKKFTISQIHNYLEGFLFLNPQGNENLALRHAINNLNCPQDGIEVVSLRECGVYASGQLITEFLKKMANLLDSEGSDINVNNSVFSMHRYCYCEQDSCAWCNNNAPNFHYIPLDFQVHWYKNIGRSMSFNKQITIFQFTEMMNACFSQVIRDSFV